MIIWGFNMKNMTLQVNIEGTQDRVLTDWNAICVILKQRHCSVIVLCQLHAELSAGLLVTTRGLTLARYQEEKAPESFIKAPVLSESDYIGSQI